MYIYINLVSIVGIVLRLSPSKKCVWRAQNRAGGDGRERSQTQDCTKAGRQIFAFRIIAASSRPYKASLTLVIETASTNIAFTCHSLSLARALRCDKWTVY